MTGSCQGSTHSWRSIGAVAVDVLVAGDVLAVGVNVPGCGVLMRVAIPSLAVLLQGEAAGGTLEDWCQRNRRLKWFQAISVYFSNLWYCARVAQ